MRSRSMLLVALAVACAATTVGCTVQEQNSVMPTPTPSASTLSPSDALVGAWASPDDPDVSLTLNGDGTMVGFDGCNTQSGTWSGPNGGAIGLEFTGQTERGCPDGVVPWLGASDGAMVDGGALMLFGPTDAPTGELVRSED
ncbi:META domain-containing protein [Microbacterium sp. ANT_H45B]|nr:META domain-containing protein [Microbacterium sp. ANT_H45B]